MLIKLPFGGFYESEHAAEFDWCIEMASEQTGIDIDEYYDQVNWRNAHEYIAREWCEYLADELKIKMQFESLKSPREYNFSMDTVYAEIEADELQRLYEATDMRIFAKIVRECCTSRSGFISFYPADLQEWPVIGEYDHNHAGLLLDAYILTMGLDAAEIETDFIESQACNGGYDAAMDLPW